jgi:hypothetical protein
MSDAALQLSFSSFAVARVLFQGEGSGKGRSLHSRFFFLQAASAPWGLGGCFGKLAARAPQQTFPVAVVNLSWAD